MSSDPEANNFRLHPLVDRQQRSGSPGARTAVSDSVMRDVCWQRRWRRLARSSPGGRKGPSVPIPAPIGQRRPRPRQRATVVNNRRISRDVGRGAADSPSSPVIPQTTVKPNNGNTEHDAENRTNAYQRLKELQQLHTSEFIKVSAYFALKIFVPLHWLWQQWRQPN